MTKRGLGYVPDTPDARDYRFRTPIALGELPPACTLPKDRQPVLDQGQLGSCVAHGTAGAVLFHQPDFMLSRLWLYYKARAMERTTKEDAGCQIRDAVKVLATKGAPPESDWPYDISKFAVRPPAVATRDAKKEVILKYERIATPREARACIASGSPYIVGFTLFESFESDEVARTGVVPDPQPGEREIGGHCVLGFGYDETHDEYLNSWSASWGDRGFFKVSHDYVQKYASDMWAIKACEQRA